MGFILIYTTHPNKEHAQKIVQALLEQKLIACANLFPMESTYKWEGKVVQEQEIVAILKTKEALWEKVKTTVKELHSYTVPCIIKLPVEATEAFTTWVDEATA